MLSLKHKVNFSVAESKLIMKMIMRISSLLEKVKKKKKGGGEEECITYCLHYVIQQTGEEEIFIVLYVSFPEI